MQERTGPDSARPQETDRDRLFEHSLDLMAIAGLDGYLRQVNPSWTRVLGWSREELLSRPVIEFVHPEDRERTLQGRRGLADGVPVKGFENRYQCKDGTYRWLSWQSTFEPGGATVLAVARDVTERRRADHEQFILGKLESAGVLAAGIAHDFNNLLASLLLNLEMVSLSGPVNERQRRHVQQATHSVHAARALTDQLIAFAEGGASIHEPTELSGLLHRAVEASLGGSNVRAEIQVAPDLWMVEIDAGQIEQALRNLLVNAREAMPGGGSVQVRAGNRAIGTSFAPGYPDGDYVCVSILDAGGGIPEHLLSKVFDPYYSTKQRGEQKGMGLGLTIARTVFHKHGGFVSVASQVGQGTTVHCFLPAAREVAKTTSPAPAVPRGTPARVLVLEDDANLRGIISQTLSHLGYDATVAEEGEEVLRLHAEAAAVGRPYGVVLLDLTVRGGLGGQEVLHALRERDPATRAVLMTGYTQEQVFRDYARHGFTSALAKPFSAEVLRTTLDQVLAGPRV